MTNEKAIKMLEYIKLVGNGESEYKNDAQAIAIELAIKALEQEPCDDCISRKEMLKYQEYLHGKMSNEENHKLWEFIKQLPSVQPTRPTAQWERLVDDFKKCSRCGRPVKFYRKYKHCPECGAKMEEVEE